MDGRGVTNMVVKKSNVSLVLQETERYGNTIIDKILNTTHKIKWQRLLSISLNKKKRIECTELDIIQ